jgi:tetratricopeptide (TPR) repeat protein
MLLAWGQQRPGDAATERFLVEIANEQGRLLRRQGRLAEARAHFEWTLRRARSLADERLTGIVTNNLARVMLESPEFVGPASIITDMLRENIDRLERQGESRHLAVSYHNLGKASARDDLVQAERCYREDVRLCRELGDELALADALDTLGLFLVDQARFGEAEQVHGEELALFDRVYDLRRQARSLANLGRCHLRQALACDDRTPGLLRARQSYDRSRRLFSSLDEPRDYAPTLENLGRVCYLLGDRQQGIHLLEQSLLQYRRWRDGELIARDLRHEIDALPPVRAVERRDVTAGDSVERNSA